MRVTLYSFFSQQSKRTLKFRLDSDSGVKLYAYIAEQMLKLGWTVRFVLPRAWQCETKAALPAGVQIIEAPYDLAVNNFDRRLQCEPSFLRMLAQCDCVLTQHQTIAYALRCVAPSLKIVQECGLRPEQAFSATAALQALAYESANLVHCNSEQLAKEQSHKNVSVWTFGYDERLVTSPSARTTDVLFNARASATNYTNHLAFTEAFKHSTLKIRMTDPTSYLQDLGDWLSSPLDVEAYLNLLRSSKVVVGLTNNGYGGYAFYEAIAHGCLPVALRLPEYVRALGEDYPHYCTLNNVREVVERALCGGTQPPDVSFASYASAWKKAKEDLHALLS